MIRILNTSRCRCSTARRIGSPFAQSLDRDSGQHRDEKHLQHIAFGQRREECRRDDVLDEVDETTGFVCALSASSAPLAAVAGVIFKLLPGCRRLPTTSPMAGRWSTSP